MTKTNKNLEFRILAADSKSKARRGIIKTKSGIINTPAFVPVGTAATVKTLTPEEIASCKTEVFFVNTYHMVFRPGTDIVSKFGGLRSFMNWKGNLMTDSGGFQAFSLSENGPRNTSGSEEKLIRITDDGIFFKSAWDGKEKFLGPVESIKNQINLGADIIMSFDECTFYPITEKRAMKALDRTHRWALAGLDYFTSVNLNSQSLYGIVQGSVYENLRKESAEFISRLGFDGFAVGSVANSREPREKVFSVLDWTMPYLYPKEKPVHFLGIGEIEDIFLSVERGIDSLDCVTPTRLGRMGWIFDESMGLKNKFRFDMTKRQYSTETKPPVQDCKCYTCGNFSTGYLNHLFKAREMLGYRLATIHNLYFFGKLMEDIRKSIEHGTFLKLKKRWLGY